jgi:hypothetical protein
MPPWKAVAGYGHFANERRLSQADIDIIARWAKAGAPEGDPGKSPSPPQFTDGWQLGKPDLILEMQTPYLVPAHGEDRYQCFALPVDIPHDVYVRAIEFRPSNRKVMHHALIFADNTHAAREATAKAGGSYSCFGTPGFLPSAAFGGWSPGTGVIRMPDGAAAKLHKGVDLVIQSHFHSRGQQEEERSRIGFYFTDQPPSKAVMDVGLVSKAIDIPAGDAAYKVRDHFELPIDVHAIGIIPHAHYVCRDMKGWAILPDGRKRWLLWVRDWDFNWQDQFRYADPIALPAGTRVEMEFTYDNSAANPHNPNSPPARVVWGPGITDEMAGLHIQVSSYALDSRSPKR